MISTTLICKKKKFILISLKIYLKPLFTKFTFNHSYQEEFYFKKTFFGLFYLKIKLLNK